MDNNDTLMILKKFLENPEENSNVDYKRELRLKHKKERKELAKDIACFANANGGYIIVGIIDGSWKRVGIDSDTFDMNVIRDVAKTRVAPSVIIKLHEISLDNLHYGVIRIEKSIETHAVDGRVYQRINDKCLPLQLHEILILENEKMEYKMKKLGAVRFPEMQGEYKDLAARLVQSYPKHSLQRQMKAILSKQGKEAKLIEERVYNGFYEQAIEATDFSIQPNVAGIPEHIMNAIALRAYGMMQIVRIGVYNELDEKGLDTGVLENQEILIHIKLNPAKMKNWLHNQSTEVFFEWMETFRGFKQNPQDKKLFENITALNRQELEEWIIKEYGLERLGRIAKLYIEFRRIFEKTIGSSNYRWVVNVGRLFTDSWSDLLRRIRKGPRRTIF